MFLLMRVSCTPTDLSWLAETTTTRPQKAKIRSSQTHYSQSTRPSNIFQQPHPSFASACRARGVGLTKECPSLRLLCSFPCRSPALPWRPSTTMTLRRLRSRLWVGLMSHLEFKPASWCFKSERTSYLNVPVSFYIIN